MAGAGQAEKGVSHREVVAVGFNVDVGSTMVDALTGMVYSVEARTPMRAVKPVNPFDQDKSHTTRDLVQHGVV